MTNAFVVVEAFEYDLNESSVEIGTADSQIDSVHLRRETAYTRADELTVEGQARLGNDDEDAGLFYNAIGYEAFVLPVPLIQ